MSNQIYHRITVVDRDGRDVPVVVLQDEERPARSALRGSAASSADLDSGPRVSRFRIRADADVLAWLVERIVIVESPEDWIINDIKVGGQSQFSHSGDIPGEMFAATTIDTFVSFSTVQTAMDLEIVATYIGQLRSARFLCRILCHAGRDD